MVVLFHVDPAVSFVQELANYNQPESIKRFERPNDL